MGVVHLQEASRAIPIEFAGAGDGVGSRIGKRQAGGCRRMEASPAHGGGQEGSRAGRQCPFLSRSFGGICPVRICHVHRDRICRGDRAGLEEPPQRTLRQQDRICPDVEELVVPGVLEVGRVVDIGVEERPVGVRKAHVAEVEGRGLAQVLAREWVVVLAAHEGLPRHPAPGKLGRRAAVGVLHHGGVADGVVGAAPAVGEARVLPVPVGVGVVGARLRGEGGEAVPVVGEGDRHTDPKAVLEVSL